MDDRILTLHPQGKEGVNISASKYSSIKESIIKALDSSSPMTFKDLVSYVRSDLADAFEGSISWYVTTIKLDLEARNLIQCKRGKGPQQLTLANAE